MHSLVERFFSSKKRKKLASSGAAMKDGSFPIENEKDLRNAEKLSGHGKNPEAARRHIKQRAKALGLETHLQEGTAVFSINLREAIRDIIKLHEEDDTGDEQEQDKPVDISLKSNKGSKLQSKIKQVFSHLPDRQITALQAAMNSHSMMRKFADLVGLAHSDLKQSALADALVSHLHGNPSAVAGFKYSSMFPGSTAVKAKDATPGIIAMMQKRGLPVPSGTVPPDPKKPPSALPITASTSSGFITATSGRGPTDPLRQSTVGTKGKETLSFTPEQIKSMSASGIKDAKELVTPKSLPRPVERQKGLDLPDFGEAPKPSTQKPENISAEELKKSVQASNELRMAVKRANDALKSKKIN